MNEFLKNNLILILTLGGAILSFLIVLTEKVAKRNKLRISIMLGAFALLVLSGQQIVSHIEQKNKDLQDEAFKKSQVLMENERKKIVEDIQAKITVTKTIVEQLNDQLKGKSPEKIGVQVIQENETNRLLPIPKRSLDWWPNYVEWLKTSRGQQKLFPCLSLTLNADNHYNLNMLLLYLFTNPNTTRFIQGLPPPEKFEFPSKEFFKKFRIPEPEVKYVLFFDGTNNQLIGYAPAILFAKELLVYLETGNQSTIENILNNPSMDFLEEFEKHFNSFSNNVLIQKDAYAVAKEMISKKYNETAVIYEDKLYIASLTYIVSLVSQ